MALFGRRRSQDSEPDDDPVQNIIDLALLRFSVHGVQVTELPGAEGANAILVDEDGTQFPLATLIAVALPLPPQSDEFMEAVMRHVDSAVESLEAPDVAMIPQAEFLERARVRISPQSISETLSVSYARPVAPGLIAILCLDSPSSIAYLSDGMVEGRDVAAVFDAGFRNVMAEPLDTVEEVAPGIHALVGDSLFTASKAIGMKFITGSVLPEAPYGVVFGIPHRHLIFVHVVTGPESVSAIGEVAKLVAAQATDDAPGGPLSSTTYFWRDNVWEPIGFPGSDGGIRIEASGLFADMLSELG